ncbi:type VII secretion target [Nocardia sp. NPDC051463]|uniref:type VII secretion target n=1 Tax=Nocardia sp. NPDC051463 TaxID=3154845 RepID=UPI0034258F19
MTNSMEIEPAVLRQLAEQHRQVARDTREWAKPPYDWLASFLPTYGKIASPVHDALVRYYDARQRAGEALALEHDHTADSLVASALSYEQHDQEMASSIKRTLEPGDGSGPSQLTQQPPAVGDSPAPSAPVPPTEVTPAGPAANTPVGAGPDAPPAQGPSAPTSTGAGPGGMGPAGTGAGAPDAGAPGTGAPGGAGVPGMAAATPDHAGSSTAPTGTGATATPPAGGLTAPPSGAGATPVAGPPLYTPMDDRAVAAPPSGASGTADGMPVPIQTPFGAAVAAAKDKAAEPAYVVGDPVNGDLVLARTLLAGVLAAVDSPVGMAWAVAVLRGPAGPGVFITSNEGRGWLPARLFLPREVSTPWMWDELLSGDDEGSASPWEGVSDPARVLAEFGLAWGAKANATLSAIVSSGPIDPGLSSRLSNVAMEGLVGPAYDVDLRESTPDTTDRLGLTGSTATQDQVAAVPDSQLRAQSMELATDAHAQVGRSVPLSAEAAGSRQLRERILADVQSGRPVPRQVWDELRDADDLMAASMLSRRVDVGRVELGQLRVDAEVSALRAMVFERRCNELVLLLAEESTTQTLRDAVYAHEQILEHPAFVPVPAPVATAAPERVERPAATGVTAPGAAAPGVTAPDIAGPPAGAVVAPTTLPPVVPPGATSDR